MLSGGRVFDREVHKSAQWDLVRIRDDYRMQFVNQLLDKMIVFEEGARMPVNDLHKKAGLARQLIAGGYAPLIPDAEVKCRYCGIGTYRPEVNSDEEFRRFFGLQPTAVGDAQRNWRILVCNHCGNLQWFRIQPDNIWWPERR
jgi:hypothetical protein